MPKKSDPALRATVLALKASAVGKTTSQITSITGLSKRTINDIFARAVQRGFDPNSVPLDIRSEHVEDARRTGRPTKQTEDIKTIIIDKVRRDRYGREKSCADLVGDFSDLGISISATTIWRILKKAGFNKTKPTRKPGLTKKMMAQRLEWCLKHQDWTLEDWKNVIWSDETSVVLNFRRGGYRVWRTADEAFSPTCIRERWKGYSEFMFWGCFTYDKKGPCHCWLPETAQEKKQAQKDIEKLNKKLEPIAKEQWELSTGMSRLGLRDKPGTKPQWSWNAKTGRLTRQKGKGIDWWRYQKEILIPKMIPFAKECMESRSGTLVQEDNAPAHKHHYQQHVYKLHEVQQSSGVQIHQI